MDMNRRYSELPNNQEICQATSSLLPIESTSAVSQQTKQRVGCWELIVFPQQVPTPTTSPKYLKR